MLIVCPNCATSYMIDPAAMPPSGRTVRCARCKTTWFAGGPTSEVANFVDGVIAEAEAQPGAPLPSVPPANPESMMPLPEPAGDDFGDEPETIASASEPPPIEHASSAAEPSTHEIGAMPETDAPPLVPPLPQTRFVDNPMPETEEVESFAARRDRMRSRRENKRRSSCWTAIILVLVAFNVALIGARNEVVRYLPQTASLFSAIGLPVNLRNLKFENVKISKETENNVDTLIVDGTIVSTGNASTEVPRLRFSVRNTAGQEIYTWTAAPARNILEAAERLDFHSRLATPPAGAIDVLVRFMTAKDAVPGAK
jgi:predicted Zn finger-like uncharacterized protein